MRAFLVFALLSVAPLSLGCSSSSDAPTTNTETDGGTEMDTLAADSSTTSTDGSSTDAAAETAHEMKAPTITMVMKMDGALHVMWTNNETGCDKVEGERKTHTEAYKVVFTVPGTVDNKMDASATTDTTYTYRLRCKMGSDYSPYSNEMSKNPVK